jgi:membrane protease YdiL (CAAX protease family)
MSPRLRALIRLSGFLVLVFVVLPAKRTWLRAVCHGVDPTAVYVLDHVLDLVVILAFGFIMASIERRPFGAFGLPWRQALRSRFWQGAAAALAALTVLVGILGATGAIQVGASSTPALQGIGFAAAYAVLFVLLAVREEFLHRGYGLFTLTEVTGFWPAALASTAWFVWSHADNPGESALGLASVAVFGLLACLMLRRTGSLWMAIGFHAAWDWGQTYFYGVGDSGHPAPPGHLLTSTTSEAAPAWLSGASVGPEGSILCTALIALLITLYAWRLRRVPSEL